MSVLVSSGSSLQTSPSSEPVIFSIGLSSRVNLVGFRFKNDDELRDLAKSGLLDSLTVESLKFLEERQCIVVGDLTSGYPIFLNVLPQMGVMMGGETRKLVH